MIHIIDKAAELLSRLLWGPWTAVLVIISGIWFSAANSCIQLRPGLWMKMIIGSLRREKADDKAISPFQSATASLAGTLGTGNIVGVATALTLGGAGSIFWMWIAALAGMAVSYAETVLGMLYRRKDPDGGWIGGPMMYIEHGLGCRSLAGIWAFFCAIAAFGVGNLTQVNSIAHSAQAAWNVSPTATCIMAALLAAPVILRGIRSVAKLTEKLIPVMTLVYILACAAVLTVNMKHIPEAFTQIFDGVFNPTAASGGIVGTMMVGIRRGIFTNEAGLGSSVLMHSSADTDDPVQQGAWGIFEVFADTVVMCTMTALVILTSGAMEKTDESGQMLDGAVLSAEAFSAVFGNFSGTFITAMLIVFAFATLISWSCCGERAFVYLCGTRHTNLYRWLYIMVIILGGMTELRTVWALSDVLNGLMLIPNTVALLLLYREVSAQTDKRLPAKAAYRNRNFAAASSK